MHARLFWHVSHLVFIALMWRVRPNSASMDVCSLTNVSMYCNCEQLYHKQTITCFVFGEIEQNGEVWKSFGEQKNTVELALRSSLNSQLSYIPYQALSELPDLETLSIHDGNVEVIETGALSDLKKLSNLNLERNEIVALERHSITDLPVLKKLALNDNKITELLADTLEGMEELEQLYLGTNNISRIEACAFCNLHNLKELELWRNSITDLTEYTFRGLRYLTRLDLEENQLKVLNERVFQAMPRLRELNIKRNQIRYISPRAFQGLDELVSLQMSDNELKRLPDNVFHHIPKLMSLNLLKNQLQTVQTELVEGMVNSMAEHFIFNFNDNPLKCDCELSWIAKYLQKAKSQMFIRELRQVKCQSSKGQDEPLQLAEVKGCEKKAKNVVIEPTPATLKSYSLDPWTGNPPQYDPAQKDEKLSTEQTPMHSVRLDESKDSTAVPKMSFELFCCIICISLAKLLLKFENL